MKSFLLSIGLTILKGDPSIFYYSKNNQLTGFIAIFVDDFLWSGTTEFEKEYITKIRNTFIIGKESHSIFQYLGLHLNEHDSEITLDQINYAENLKPINDIDKTKTKELLQSQIGKLLWMSGQTRPDIAFDVCQLGTNFKNCDGQDIKYANKITTHIKQDPVQITYQHLGNDDDLKILIFADASHGNLVDGGSQLGYLILLVGNNGKCSLINWQSKRIKRVVRSTLAAETLALSEAVDDGMYLAEMISELLFNKKMIIPIEIYTDNKSLHDSIISKKNVLEKRLRIDIAMLRELFEQKRITKIHHINTNKQIANSLTKKGASTKELLNMLEKGVISI